MFEFVGSLSESVIAQYGKEQSKRVFCCFLMILLPLTALVIVLTFVLPKDAQIKELWICLIICYVFCIFVRFAPAKSMAYRISKTITFDLDKDLITIKETFIMQNPAQKPVKKLISKIKKIVDYGDWYLLCFKGDITNIFALQKNHIMNTKIEDFESTFKDKIVQPNIKRKQK